MAHQCYCWVTCSWSIGPSHNVYFFWFVLHRKMHCSFSILHTIHIHTALARIGFLENHQSTHLTTYHRRISANASKQGKKATVSTARCVFQWHATQHGLAINYLEAGENIEGNSPSRNKTINGISSWIHLGIISHVNMFFNCIASFSVFPPSSYCETFCLVWINWSQCPQLSKQGETEDDNTNTYQEVFTSHLIGPSGSLMRMVLMSFLRQTKAAASCM